MKYTCTHCGKEHNEYPALTFKAPDNYYFLSEKEKKTIATINDDFCVIEYSNQTDRFIRCTLIQQINDHCVNLEYGLWVSLSEKNFNDYQDNFNNENHETGYFGWLCNQIPDYKFNQSIPTSVFTQKGNQRPIIVPHEDFDHPFVKDYYHGITKEEAERRIEIMLNNI